MLEHSTQLGNPTQSQLSTNDRKDNDSNNDSVRDMVNEIGRIETAHKDETEESKEIHSSNSRSRSEHASAIRKDEIAESNEIFSTTSRVQDERNMNFWTSDNPFEEEEKNGANKKNGNTKIEILDPDTITPEQEIRNTFAKKKDADADRKRILTEIAMTAYDNATKEQPVLALPTTPQPVIRQTNDEAVRAAKAKHEEEIKEENAKERYVGVFDSFIQILHFLKLRKEGPEIEGHYNAVLEKLGTVVTEYGTLEANHMSTSTAFTTLTQQKNNLGRQVGKLVEEKFNRDVVIHDLTDEIVETKKNLYNAMYSMQNQIIMLNVAMSEQRKAMEARDEANRKAMEENRKAMEARDEANKKQTGRMEQMLAMLLQQQQSRTDGYERVEKNDNTWVGACKR